jgi:hypothetical protein
MVSLPHPSPTLQAERSQRLMVQQELMDLHRRGEPAVRLVVNLLSQELEGVKDRLVSADPASLSRLQGEAQAYKKLLDFIRSTKTD